LTRFLDANRASTPDQVRGRLSLESAMVGANQRKGQRSFFATGKRFVKSGPAGTIFHRPEKTSTNTLK
jgi:hypothetical protein